MQAGQQTLSCAPPAGWGACACGLGCLVLACCSQPCGQQAAAVQGLASASHSNILQRTLRSSSCVPWGGGIVLLGGAAVPLLPLSGPSGAALRGLGLRDSGFRPGAAKGSTLLCHAGGHLPATHPPAEKAHAEQSWGGNGTWTLTPSPPFSTPAVEVWLHCPPLWLHQPFLPFGYICLYRP